MHDNGKFREFVARQQAKEGVKPLHELLCLPVRHIVHYVRVYQGNDLFGFCGRSLLTQSLYLLRMLKNQLSHAITDSRALQRDADAARRVQRRC